MVSAVPLVKSASNFPSGFAALTGNPPYPWQQKLFDLLVQGEIPPDINLPTGSGKTSIMPIWLLALAHQAQQPKSITLPRRLVWVVNRRVVVDQASDEARQIREHLSDKDGCPALDGVRDALQRLSLNREKSKLIAISTLRGETEDNREWTDDPSRPAIIVGTVDMIGSRLLFSGYGDGKYWRVQHAGLLGQDTLIVNDEAHLTAPFASLLSSVENRQKQTGIKPFRTIRLSATHPSSKCWPESLDEDQKNERFAAIFKAHKQVRIRDAGKQDSTLFDLAAEPAAARTLIFVQQPDKVKEISERLKKRVGEEAGKRILTLTGTMRGIERDRMAESPVFKAFAEAQPPSESYWLIATSAGEVGINISADRLITDLSTLDHLLQRFGRLNRFGETEGAAYVLTRKADEDDERKKQALAFLRSLPPCSEEAYDISPAALFGRELPPEACQEPPLEAKLHDWLIDVWSQTTLGSHPARPAVEPWLHGKQDNYPETYIAWREDVRELASENIGPSERKAVLQKYRILAHERLQEPTISLVKKFGTLLEYADPRTPTHILCCKPDGSVTSLELHQLWGDDAFANMAFCQLILPPDCGAIRDGMFSPEWAPNGENSPAATDGTHPHDVSGCLWNKKLQEIATNEERASYRAVRNADDTWTATRLGTTIVETVLFEDKDKNKDLELVALHEFAAGRGWRFLLKITPEPEDDESKVALLYFGKAQKTTGSVVVLPVAEHLDDVSREARALTASAGLPEELAFALAKAGQLHDLGKEAPIWQKAAGNLKFDGEYEKGGPVAKPIKVMRGKELGGFRHELASLPRAEKKLKDENIAPDLSDLILHLVAAHHGNARPCFEKRAYDRNDLKGSADLALRTAQRFAKLQERYGAWGLAYLESILRAADGIASADSAAEEQAE